MDKKRIAIVVGVLGGVGILGHAFLGAARARGPAAAGEAACRELNPQPLARPGLRAGQEAPDFDLTDVNGKTWSLRALRGRPVLLNFWATWCAPCREEMPSLEALARSTADVAIITVNVDADTGAAKKFFPKGTNLTVLLDPEKAAAGRFGTEKFPESFLIDRAGRVQQLFHQAKWGGAAAEECLGSI